MTKKLVKFKKGHGRYNAGETAAFEADVADKLCKGDDAVATLVGKVKPVPAASTGSAEAKIAALTAELDELTEQIEVKDQEIAALTAQLDAASKQAAPDPAPEKAVGAPPKTKA